MRIAKIFLDDQKEEQWLNHMANEGWHFKQLHFPYYSFEQGTPGEYTYRLEMLAGLGTTSDAKDYLEFVESTGIEVVQKRFNWAYFRQHNSKGTFELYSDAVSKLEYVKRMFTIYCMLFIGSLGVAIFNIVLALINNAWHISGFASGICTGAIVVLTIPFIKLIKRKRYLKKQIEFEN